MSKLSEGYGARELRRLIQGHIVQLLAAQMKRSGFPPLSTVLVSAKDRELVIAIDDEEVAA